MLIREQIEQKEKLILIPQAAFSCRTKGRYEYEESDNIRTAFMVDRDRIIHSKSFRRLKHKTQVYIRVYGDHYRTRLTHTLEVNQIGKTIGKGIGLNEDLIEAIAMAHDIGHVPFAHSGEEVLNELVPGGFKHTENSIRVLTRIEKDGKGLNLTREVLDGVLKHSGFSNPEIAAFTLEGQVVKYSDKIAYINHDIDDSIRAGILKSDDLPQNPRCILGKTNSERINTLVTDCIYTTIENIKKGIMKVSLSSEVFKALDELRNFMFEEIYHGNFLKEERQKAKFVLRQVFNHFYKYPDKMPGFYRKIVEMEGLLRGVTDYISGMSDDYCLMLFNDIYIPKNMVY
ncbi:MAG: deoxyguanosinetriphosphate triphosphohydrolase [Clostridium sp.]|jgi:dGTPase|uniref:deoxyguanosinetriphosphate triphosphohydrolase n=1 Tax=Clostridium sp. TaxID=1506 RepID=UPI0025B877D1|nr:deoxyguanosinetriphosphate triphosphohydrolase [Clostridium sp.]MCH3964674.1 deoxyguanosinetriphosphate triphosphohydrolase [Clostridium sp.]MCI1715145.1 deoxyguanosinetriphosphate triphosphohydrolase [Clostridium sp.]MCI1799407.1 deoxyguanosinetriphosphate triphosphohydrolase [Clostridium sp.]MCI1813328.1 deoxyguanosinetriphosphate triphosphohydrolase [Clostridium sp.]MCI1870219.1 deoxyguanosinetriphosphate triphosphohydrolase [Clostridium sp.]